MNKLIVACVALSFALLACSDESSPVASGSLISGGGVSSVTLLSAPTITQFSTITRNPQIPTANSLRR